MYSNSKMIWLNSLLFGLSTLNSISTALVYSSIHGFASRSWIRLVVSLIAKIPTQLHVSWRPTTEVTYNEPVPRYRRNTEQSSSWLKCRVDQVRRDRERSETCHVRCRQRCRNCETAMGRLLSTHCRWVHISKISWYIAVINVIGQYLLASYHMGALDISFFTSRPAV